MNNDPETNQTEPISDKSFNLLIQEMEKVFPISNAFKRQLRPLLFEISCKKGSKILNAGAKQRIVWFMLEGLAREIKEAEYHLNKKTTWIWSDLAFIYVVPGFFDQEPTLSTIKTITATKMVFISYENWKILKETYEETEKLTEKIRTAYELERQRHANDIHQLSTTDLYLKHKDFLKTLFPHLQLQYIAEYLGMSADTLGKLRKRFLD